MWKVLFIAAALGISMSPVDAAQPEERRVESELKREVGRIAAEIYPRRPERSSPRPSFAASGTAKKR